jgi:hypothetical protein
VEQQVQKRVEEEQQQAQKQIREATLAALQSQQQSLGCRRKLTIALSLPG